MPDQNQTITLVDRGGNPVAVPIDKAGEMLQSNLYRIETQQDKVDRAATQAEEDVYGGAAGTVLSGLAGFGSTASGGLTDVGIGALGGGETLSKIKKHHEIANVVGGVLGAVSPTGFSGLASRAGAGVARAIGEGSAASKILGAAAGSATEGALYGGQEAITERALSDDPLNVERGLSALGSKMLYGGVAGGVAGGLTKAAEVGLLSARSKIGDAVASAGKVDQELASKTPSQLSDLHEAEVKQLADQQVATRSSAVDDLVTYRQQMREANPYIVADDKATAQLAKANAQFETALDAPKSLRSNPASLGKNLEKQEQALERTIAERESLMAKFQETNEKIVGDLKQKIAEAPLDAGSKIDLDGKAMKRYAAYADVRIPKGTASLSVDRAAVEEFVNQVSSGAAKNRAEQSLGKLDGLLQANRDLQAKIEAGKIPRADLTSARLDQIKAAKADVEAQLARKPGIGEQIAQGAIFSAATGALAPVLGHLAPLVGAKVAKIGTDLVTKRLGKATAEIAGRTDKAVELFLSGTKGAQKVAPVLASKVLARAQFAPSSAANDNEPAGKDLASMYKRRADEIKSQTEYMADGKAAMRPEARAQMAKQLAGVAAVDPNAADQLETVGARKMEFLANKIPRRPDIGGVPIGPDKWQPSELEMRAFARYVSAVEDPAAIVERLAHGTITPEDAEAMRTVYPEMFQGIQAQIINGLPALRKQLPYDRRVALSIFSGVPVDAAMHPKVFNVLQSQFAEEQGSEEGTQAPAAAPQFGSISKPEPTAAQQRSS